MKRNLINNSRNIYKFDNEIMQVYTLKGIFLFYADSNDFYILEKYRWRLKDAITGDCDALIDGVRIKAHRYIMGVRDSTLIVDHKDRDHRNNRRQNLRTSDYTGNGYNRKAPYNNKSGCKGVARRKDSCKWVAYINLNKKRRHLGTFIDIEEAIETRKKFERIIYPGWHFN